MYIIGVSFEMLPKSPELVYFLWGTLAFPTEGGEDQEEPSLWPLQTLQPRRFVDRSHEGAGMLGTVTSLQAHSRRRVQESSCP